MDLTEIRNRVMRRAGVQLVDDVDDEINMVQRQYIQPVAAIHEEAEYETTEADEEIVLTALANDIYRLNYIIDITHHDRGISVPLLHESRTEKIGARRQGSKIRFVGIQAERKLLVAYHKQLKELGTMAGQVSEPEIPEQWHDLYWMGALSMFIPDYFPIFQDRLREFKLERKLEGKPYGMPMKVRKEW